ncbi:PTS galactitol transporter subunit IIC [Clostridium sp. C8]|uniref:PTS galactitol transporter subunit IIC n=1 Tax=Clostridium sp. C8 TaxID=1667357 RepID=UPI00062E6E58|nr:PTS galactitol transporter subunit IIC [Clostridium sp. C8]KLE15681.1 PTS system galactitol-specific transporter subunit IIC [Clostridium sp. C8]
MGEKLLGIVQYVLGLGPTVMLPIVVFILAICFRVKLAKALRSALTIGIGFVGIYAIFGILSDSLGPATQALVANTGINLPVMDLGWPPLSAITWAAPIAPFVIVLTILINVVMLAFNWTKTVDIDLWNYWHFAFAGALVYASTGSFLLGIVSSGVVAIIVIKLADWSAPAIQKYFNLPGVSLPTLSSIVFFPIGVLGDKIIDKIPGLNKLDASPEKIQKKFGIFGEPMMIGVILGVLLGIIAGYDLKGILSLGINLGAVMLILPRMVRILMEGLIPLSDAIKGFLKKKYPNRSDLYMGLDIAVAIGNPAVISTALLLTPIAVLLAVAIPGNRILPLGDLANLAVMISMVVLVTKGNVVRSVLIGIPIMIGDLLVASAVAPLVTKVAKSINFEFPAGYNGEISSFLDGGNPFRFWILKIFEGNILALVLIPVVGVLLYWVFKVTKNQLKVDAGNDANC